MVDISTATVVYGLLFGAIGGGVYAFYNHLLSVATYLGALEHIGAGAVVGVLGILAFGYADPSVAGVTWATVFPLVVLGYFGVDVIDSLAQDIASSTPPTTTPPST